MGVYIKGFRKPTYCQECPLTFDYDCMIQHEQRDSLIDQYKHCPIIEVTEPHGRLIDIRCVEDNKFVAIENNSQRWWNGALDSIIDNVPTVIEAEGE